MERNLVLFDTNVWKHLASQKTSDQLRRSLRGLKLRGAISPVVVDELVRTPQFETRDAQLAVACRHWWKRLMPNALLDAEQLIGAVRRHRQDWLRAEPDHRKWTYERAAYLGDSKGYWAHVRKYPRAHAEANRWNDRVREVQADTTRLAREDAGPFDSTDVLEAMNAPIRIEAPHTHLHGRVVESWRYQAARTVWALLDPTQSGPMYRMWHECFLDLGRITLADWWDLWIEAVDPADVSRQWLRSAVFHLQATRKVGPGVAGDLALSTHLVDVGTLATFDRPYFEILDRVTRVSPFPVATPLHANNVQDLVYLLPPR